MPRIGLTTRVLPSVRRSATARPRQPLGLRFFFVAACGNAR
ncbi:MAG TPA: hypothetical protein VIL20_09690 [Sandaracinaceae bacterium]